MRSHLSEKHSLRLEWMIVILITIEVDASDLQKFKRYFALWKHWWGNDARLLPVYVYAGYVWTCKDDLLNCCSSKSKRRRPHRANALLKRWRRPEQSPMSYSSSVTVCRFLSMHNKSSFFSFKRLTGKDIQTVSIELFFSAVICHKNHEGSISKPSDFHPSRWTLSWDITIKSFTVLVENTSSWEASIMWIIPWNSEDMWMRPVYLRDAGNDPMSSHCWGVHQSGKLSERRRFSSAATTDSRGLWSHNPETLTR